MDINAIVEEALNLPMQDRAALANRLLASLEHLGEAEFERLWVRESLARSRVADDSDASVNSASDVARKARALLR